MEIIILCAKFGGLILLGLYSKGCTSSKVQFTLRTGHFSAVGGASFSGALLPPFYLSF